jgi:hypothetical protein
LLRNVGFGVGEALAVTKEPSVGVGEGLAEGSIFFAAAVPDRKAGWPVLLLEGETAANAPFRKNTEMNKASGSLFIYYVLNDNRHE